MSSREGGTELRTFRFLVLVSIALGWVLAACSPARPQAEIADSPLAVPTIALPPTVTPSLIELTVLHTNDNWGETEPRG